MDLHEKNNGEHKSADQIDLSKEGQNLGIVKEKDILIIGMIFPTLFLDKIYSYLIKFSQQKNKKIIDKDDIYTLNKDKDLLKNNTKVNKLNENSTDKFYSNMNFKNLFVPLFLFFISILLILLSSLLFSPSESKQKNKQKPKLLLSNSASDVKEEVTLFKYILYQIVLNYKGILSGITFLIQLVNNSFDTKKKKNKLISTIIKEIKKIKGKDVCFIDKNQLIEMSSSYNIKKGEFIHKYLSDVNAQLLNDNTKEKETETEKEKKTKNNFWIYIVAVFAILFVLGTLIIFLYRNFENISNTIEKLYSEINSFITSNINSNVSESKIDKIVNMGMMISKFVFGEGFVYVGMKVALGFVYKQDNEESDCILKEIYYEIEKKKLGLKKEEKYTWKNGLNLDEIKKIVKSYYENETNIDDILLGIREKLTINEEIEIVLNENNFYYLLKNKKKEKK